MCIYIYIYVHAHTHSYVGVHIYIYIYTITEKMLALKLKCSDTSKQNRIKKDYLLCYSCYKFQISSDTIITQKQIDKQM